LLDISEIISTDSPVLRWQDRSGWIFIKYRLLQQFDFIKKIPPPPLLRTYLQRLRIVPQPFKLGDQRRNQPKAEMKAQAISPIFLSLSFLLSTEFVHSFSETRVGFAHLSILPRNLKALSHVKSRPALAARIKSNVARLSMVSESISEEVADTARLLYSGNEDEAQPGWNKLQMDFVLVRSFMKLDNRFKNSSSRAKSLLSAVVEMGRVDLVGALLRMGAGVNDRDHAGRTALMAACSSEKQADWDKLIDLLLSAGADIQARDSNGDTALHMAQR
jgi:hypothetical protein